ncbi:MAG: oligosaccharide flippase family protein [Verrucomicrobiae bacterium]|nr:oligosaccharide flippase family protein [Verrucomicrobiae bacterium]
MKFSLQTTARQVFPWQRANQLLFLARNILLARYLLPSEQGSFAAGLNLASYVAVLSALLLTGVIEASFSTHLYLTEKNLDYAWLTSLRTLINLATFAVCLGLAASGWGWKALVADRLAAGIFAVVLPWRSRWKPVFRLDAPSPNTIIQWKADGLNSKARRFLQNYDTWRDKPLWPNPRRRGGRWYQRALIRLRPSASARQAADLFRAKSRKSTLELAKAVVAQRVARLFFAGGVVSLGQARLRGRSHSVEAKARCRDCPSSTPSQRKKSAATSSIVVLQEPPRIKIIYLNSRIPVFPWKFIFSSPNAF